MSVFAIGSLITGIGGSFFGSAASLYAAMNTRQAMYGKVQTYSFYEVDKLTTASIITRMSNDVQRYQQNLQMIFTMLFRSPVTLAISIVNAFTKPMGNVTYGCIVIAIVVVMLTVVAIIGFKVMPIFTKAQKKLDDTNAVMRENILGSRVIKAFNIQKNQADRYDSKNKGLRKYNIRGQALMLPIMTVIQFILNAAIIIILIVAGVQLVKGDNHPAINSGIFAFSQLILIVLFSSLIAVMVIVVTTRTYASIKRINEVLDIEPSITETKTPTHFNNDYSVEFDHVNFKYIAKTKEYALKNINFLVPTGETLGIIGGTGSGKSTIANLIPRFYDVTSGAIKIGGVNIKDITFSELNDKVGVVLQESILFSGTIESNLKFGKGNATVEQMNEALKNACAYDFVKKLPEKINSHVEQRGRNFSGGQKQRLSIARTLIKKPNILILDDTTSALDLITEAQVQENLKKNFAQTTKIIISQRVSSVKNANTILVLEDGKVVGQGQHDDLIKSCNVYKEIVYSQLGKEGM
jgi:ATP-binding cassette subfamily B protein